MHFADIIQHKSCTKRRRKVTVAALNLPFPLVESNGSLPPGLWLTSPAGWLPRTGISSGTLIRSVIECRLPLPFTACTRVEFLVCNFVCEVSVRTAGYASDSSVTYDILNTKHHVISGEHIGRATLTDNTASATYRPTQLLSSKPFRR